MSIRDERRAAAVVGMAEHLLAQGLAGASLRPLAKAAGVSDRMLLYYFADKDEVVAQTLLAIAGRLQAELADAASEPAPPASLAPRLWDILQSPRMKPIMALWLEISAAAARGQAPYEAIASQVAEGFLDWVEVRLLLPDGVDRRAVAALVLGTIDGLVMLNGVGQAALAQRALGAWDVVAQSAGDLPSPP
jgi:AcrR family transcriptional regulator